MKRMGYLYLTGCSLSTLSHIVVVIDFVELLPALAVSGLCSLLRFTKQRWCRTGEAFAPVAVHVGPSARGRGHRCTVMAPLRKDLPTLEVMCSIDMAHGTVGL